MVDTYTDLNWMFLVSFGLERPISSGLPTDVAPSAFRR
jgi:hypothetical protein